jgi:hypothetical protein
MVLEDFMLDLERDIETSERLQNKYDHMIGYCYYNTLELLLNNEIDYLVIGYSISKDGKGDDSVYHHCYGIKDNKIIDSSECGLYKDMNTNNYLMLYKLDKKQIYTFANCLNNNIEISYVFERFIRRMKIYKSELDLKIIDSLRQKGYTPIKLY